jgi:hypothetical protein
MALRSWLADAVHLLSKPADVTRFCGRISTKNDIQHAAIKGLESSISQQPTCPQRFQALVVSLVP